MSNQFSKIIRIYSFILIFFTIFISIFFIPLYSNFDIILSPSTNTPLTKVISPTSELCWPLPGYTKISSPFGYRDAPTSGASSFHGGVDLPAPPGTNIISAISGKVTFTGFMGSGGCTVIVQNENYTVVFHHVNPNFLVHPGEYVIQGQIIAQVGPKNVYGFSENPYRDEKRKSNKWSYNRPSSTLHNKKRIELYRPNVIILKITYHRHLLDSHQFRILHRIHLKSFPHI